MTGYQESVTDPSYAGQIIVFTYPLIGNYGVSGAAMESEAATPAGWSCATPRTARTPRRAEGGWLDWLDDTGTPGISGVDTRALVRHIRDRGAMRGGIFPATTPEAEARERIAAEPSMAGADFARTVTPAEPVRLGRRGPARGRDRHRDQALDRPPVPRARLPRDPAALRLEPGAGAGRGPRRWSSSPTAPATRRRSTTSSTPSAS